MDCQKQGKETDQADYKLIYAGKSLGASAWTVSVTLNRDLSFEEIADLKISEASGIFYSVLMPQKPSYQKGEALKHHVMGKAELSPVELWGVLP